MAVKKKAAAELKVALQTKLQGMVLLERAGPKQQLGTLKQEPQNFLVI